MRKKITAVFTAVALVITTVSTGNITLAQTASSDVKTMEKVSGADQATENSLKASGETTQYAPNDKVTIIVELKDTPLLEKYEEAEQTGSLPSQATSFDEYADTNQAEQITDNLEQKQDKVADEIENLKSVGNVDVLYNYTSVMNGFATEVEYKALDDIKKLPNVKAAYVAGSYDRVEPVMDSSVNTIGAKDTWDLNYKGEGTVVAILDTGLDYNHESFKTDPTSPRITSADIQSKIDASAGLKSGVTKATDTYRSLKVPYAYDYADQDTDVNPSPESVEKNGNSHGTHVAGTVAGNGNIVGVAPEAQLMIMKVFSDHLDDKGAGTEDIVAALDDTVTLGADVINMSLGSSNGFTNEGEQSVTDVYNRIEAAGITLAVSAGNSYSMTHSNGLSGMALASNPDTAVVGSPSTYEACTSVASVINAKYHAYYFTVDSKQITYSESAVGSQPTFSATLSTVSGGALDYVVVPKVGNEEDYNGIDVNGKVALIQRGSINFDTKVVNAKNHGAIAAIIYDNKPGDKLTMAIDHYDIPAVFITLDDGTALVNATDKVLHVTSDQGVFTNNKVNQLSDFSSWGVTPDLKLKPEIAAPGENIYSALPGGKYGSMNGTSMAAPHIAGSFALVKEYLNNKFATLTSVDKAKLSNQLLMSTAEPSKDANGVYYSPRKQGSGVVNIYRAVTTSGYLYTAADVEANQRPKLNLGDDASKTGSFTKSFHVKNVSGSAITYDFSAATLTETEDGGTVAESSKDISSNTSVKYIVNGKEVNSLTLQPNDDVEVTVVIQLDQTAKDYLDASFENGEFVDGYVFLKGSNTCDLSIPFMGFYGDWTKAPLFDSGSANDLQGYQQTIHALYTNGGNNYLGVNPFDSIAYKLIGNYNPFIYGDKYAQLQPQADLDKIAISPNGDGDFDSFEVAQLSLLRNAKELDWSITSDANKVIKSGVLNYERKSIYNSTANGVAPTYINDVTFDGKDENGQVIANNKTVTFSVKGTLDYSAHDQNNTNATLTFPVTIDTEKPSFVGLTASTDSFKISVKDNQYVSVVFLYDKTDLSTPVAKTLVDEDTKGATTVVNVDLKALGLTGKSPSDYVIKVYDYAMNSATYSLVTEPTNNYDPSTPSTPVASPVPTKAPGDEKTASIGDVKVSPSKVDLFVNETDDISVTLPKLTKDDVTSTSYSSSNARVAAVSSTGHITAVSEGTATITTTVKINKESKSFTTTVTVKKPYISFEKSVKSLKVGKTYTFKIDTYGIKGTPKYSVSNKKVATINSKTGKLKALKPGKVVVTVKIGSVTKKITVTIKK
ncbi:S8 family serine peptidase [Anaeromicropila herbilytica]|uniref:BIG2 domain-containing protein n=1 Tax=Anaeromicropila herbilytica TaxID=2785025 RepID=A0A7R7EQ73_9FIRM|nr:S8 family serine peptidase [Anaeromicropila herbilytica]BCN32909.1 hypothetical protein bsdtb5_42040 [Anaeromicropila herbilytica]